VAASGLALADLFLGLVLADLFLGLVLADLSWGLTSPMLRGGKDADSDAQQRRKKPLDVGRTQWAESSKTARKFHALVRSLPVAAR